MKTYAAYDLLALHTEWVGDAQFRVRVRSIKRTDKIIVDVTELSGQRLNRKGVALKIARQQARKHGAASMDATVLCEYRADKRTMDLDGKVGIVKIRQSSYVFHGA